MAAAGVDAAVVLAALAVVTIAVADVAVVAVVDDVAAVTPNEHVIDTQVQVIFLLLCPNLALACFQSRQTN